MNLESVKIENQNKALAVSLLKFSISNLSFIHESLNIVLCSKLLKMMISDKSLTAKCVSFVHVAPSVSVAA